MTCLTGRCLTEQGITGMNNSDPTNDPQKKYWWLILVAVPILIALIAIVPDLFKNGESEDDTPSTMQTGDVNQQTGEGHNINNVQGDVTITE